MGKSPGKWFRSLLAGRKSSKSSTSKKSSNEKALVISTNAALSGLSVHPPLISELVAGSAGGTKEDSNLDKGGVTDEVSLPSMKQDEDEQNTCLTLPEDTEKMRLEEATTKTQAIFRGYLARRAFFRLKGVIRLQAAIRGHLVRRQAVATLYCIHGIVKLQAHARGQIVRGSSIGCEVITKRGLGQQDSKQFEYQRNNASKLAQELSKNEFATKLLGSSPTVMPLHLQYSPEEPNSSQEWLVRWTLSHIWRPRSKPKTLSNTKHKKVEADMAVSKHNGRKVLSRKTQNGSNHSSSGSEKKKSIPLVNSVLQNPGSEIKKVKHNLKKVSSPILEKPVQSEADTERKRQNHDTTSSALVPEGSMTSGEPLKSLEGTTENSTNVETPSETLVMDDTITHLDSLSVSDTHHKSISDAADSFSPSDMHQKLITANREDSPVANDNSCTNHDNEGNESNMTNRRVSLPASHDVDAGTPTARKVPSYMAPTKSAKAKLKEQASPRFGQDVSEKNALSRRHSLPSPMNGKLSSSPRVQRLVLASAKEGIKIDRSLSSSRDGTDKMTRAEWKR
ncbi:protein IQ-DOMAIN 29 [Nicotiana tabacum]|uniref:Protein IQ-DOMAIN 31 n=1 Tax=Nicotiana tabacum TaxID=4097 RepID=A0A1S3YJV7_TOBAC|nr:PREDICTED: protein IQ-DOMAIN 31-like [Nicotiana tabacum]XP_016452388.1 PREDICTED: protein IQ-DOMAIN 31-like [Nicotiana tabacum]XP_016452389.1 PREDICTED: protein IQ-DOMAIN 31-like [Nicotiana tabacum]XP_016452390.1 PREDICTED: protein IQ-DOMAIN 31-like [Nicotiana tabacum]XP_016452391.1 PREDICTED: protein IQ-DOMAIN 31-like [Nicotiana tabacum]XP_016452392.1 PREDICTED: protein IQ-DOMAIN 31-like [Nicotiana tabacum]